MAGEYQDLERYSAELFQALFEGDWHPIDGVLTVKWPHTLTTGHRTIKHWARKVCGAGEWNGAAALFDDVLLSLGLDKLARPHVLTVAYVLGKNKLGRPRSRKRK